MDNGKRTEREKMSGTKKRPGLERSRPHLVGWYEALVCQECGERMRVFVDAKTNETTPQNIPSCGHSNFKPETEEE